MNHSAFDDHIKKQFGDFQPEVPPHIWENIAAAKNKRRPIAWWPSVLKNNKILIILGALLLGFLGFLLFKGNRQYDPSPADLTGQPSTNNQSQKNNLPIMTDSGNPEEQHTKADIQPGPATINQSSPGTPLPGTSPATDNASPGDQDRISSYNQPSAPSAGNNTTASSARDKFSATDQDKFASNSRPLLQTDRSNKPIAPSTDNRKDLSAPDGSTSVNIISAGMNKNRKQKKDRSRMLASISEPDTETGDNNAIDKTSDPVTANDNLAELNRKILAWQKMDEEKKFARNLIHKSFNLSPVPCPEKNAAGNKKYIEVYGAVDYAFRKFNDTAHSQYLQKRKESTSFSSAFSGGIRYTRVFSNAMSFRAGLNYSQVNEKFRYVQDNIVQMVYIINTNGDTTGSYSTSYTRYKVTQNRYRTIDLPVTIGYEMGNERLHANLNAGVVMNIYSWQKGDVLDTAYRPVSITTGKGQSPYQFKTNIGLGFTAAASIYLKLNDRLHLLGEPYIRYNLSPANKADITLKQKYTTIGFRLGLRLDL